ncbi:MAG: deoxyhypusine synthase [Candidatus Bathyarchaeia archaeon]
MPHVGHIKIRNGMRVRDIIREMSKTGVLGAGRLGRAVEIAREIFKDEDYTCFLGLAGPIVPGGLRQVIRDLICNNYLDVIVSTGANITHDIIEALGYRHKIGRANVDDTTLRRMGVGRIYDINIKMKAFEALERSIYKMIDEIPVDLKRNVSGYEILWEIGKRLHDENSILKAAYRKEIPIICPALHDSILGMNLWTYSTLKPLIINSFKDFTKLVEISTEAKKAGAIIIGGGLPKHHLLLSNTLRGGLDAAVQITMDRPEAGGLSGAPLEEAISWRKVRGGERIVTLIGDATILFPLIVASAIERK